MSPENCNVRPGVCGFGGQHVSSDTRTAWQTWTPRQTRTPRQTQAKKWTKARSSSRTPSGEFYTCSKELSRASGSLRAKTNLSARSQGVLPRPDVDCTDTTPFAADLTGAYENQSSVFETKKQLLCDRTFCESHVSLSGAFFCDTLHSLKKVEPTNHLSWWVRLQSGPHRAPFQLQDPLR